MSIANNKTLVAKLKLDLRKLGINVTTTEIYEALSQACGFSNWNLASHKGVDLTKELNKPEVKTKLQTWISKKMGCKEKAHPYSKESKQWQIRAEDVAGCTHEFKDLREAAQAISGREDLFYAPEELAFVQKDKEEFKKLVSKLKKVLKKIALAQS